MPFGPCRRPCSQDGLLGGLTFYCEIPRLSNAHAQPPGRAGKARFFAGDWSALGSSVLEAAGLLHSYDVILAAETIYSESSFAAFIGLLQQVSLAQGRALMNSASCCGVWDTSTLLHLAPGQCGPIRPEKRWC